MICTSLSAGGHAVTAWSAGEGSDPAIWGHFDAEEAEAVARALAEDASCPGFTLFAVTDIDWNRDLSPWPAPRAFHGGEDFAGGADAWLRVLCGEVLPACEQALGLTPRWRGIAGYSLAGLFALYAICRTDRFARAASMSGSLWYDGFLPWFRNALPLPGPERIYLSVGDRESRSKSPRLQTVAARTDEAADFLRERGIPTANERNPGGHFEGVTERVRRGIDWLLR